MRQSINFVYIIKSMILLQFGRKTLVPFVFLWIPFPSHVLFSLEVGMEIKCFESIILFIVYVCKITGFLK